MTYKIDEIEGIGPAFASKLTAAKIMNTDQLLAACGDAKGRTAVAASTGIDEARLLKWANMADLMRINGVGKQFAELLEAAGVDTVKELRTRNAENLAAKMHEINTTKRLTHGSVSASIVAGWIEQAKTLDPSISH
jgi:predicted flap endonuclease-1-like 5' DNA nuclease